MYFEHRAAWSPRVWLGMLVTIAVVVPVQVALAFVGVRVEWWAGAIEGGLIGLAAVRIQWWLWRRRHPPLSVLERRRRQAWLN